LAQELRLDPQHAHRYTLNQEGLLMTDNANKDLPREAPLDLSDITTTYANWYQVVGTPEELIVDFGLTPTLGIATEKPIRVKQRLVMSFWTAKRLLTHLHYAIRRYESAFGPLEIDVPTRLQALSKPKPSLAA
jgi:hypothetical protein